MEVVTLPQIQEWLRLDPDTDIGTLNLLVSSAIDIVEHETGRTLRPYVDPLTTLTVTPVVPESLKHAVAVFVSAHFDDRAGSNEAAMKTVKALCLPYRVSRL